MMTSRQSSPQNYSILGDFELRSLSQNWGDLGERMQTVEEAIEMRVLNVNSG